MGASYVSLSVTVYIYIYMYVYIRKYTYIQVWRNGSLVAGEFGVCVGACYVSLSGFRKVSCAGSIQCAATARLLQSGMYACMCMYTVAACVGSM